MARKAESHTFENALRELERNLETPVVPGEMAAWSRSLLKSLKATGLSLQEIVHDVHEERFRQISEQDPALLPRVVKLRQEDQQLMRDFEDVARLAAGLEPENEDVQSETPDVDDALDSLVKSGIAFVIRARTQEAALSTWHMEAFQRDRGVGD